MAVLDSQRHRVASTVEHPERIVSSACEEPLASVPLPGKAFRTKWLASGIARRPPHGWERPHHGPSDVPPQWRVVPDPSIRDSPCSPVCAHIPTKRRTFPWPCGGHEWSAAPAFWLHIAHTDPDGLWTPSGVPIGGGPRPTDRPRHPERAVVRSEHRPRCIVVPYARQV